MEASEVPLSDTKLQKEILDGAELYEVLAEMLAEDDISLSELDLAAIAGRIAQLDTELTAEPSNAPDTHEQREEAEREIARVNREKALEPIGKTIDKDILAWRIVVLFAGYGSFRPRLRAYIENHVIATGQLPTGEHVIRVQDNGMGYSAGRHNFGDEFGSPN